MGTRSPKATHELLTPQEVAEGLRIGRTKVYELMRDQMLGSITIGRRRFITRDQLNRFCAARAQMSLPPGVEQKGAHHEQ